LHRAEFARQLACDIWNWRGRDEESIEDKKPIAHSLTIALYGGWGSGKSSVKSMIVEKIDELNKSTPSLKVPIFEFNPWQISDEGSMMEHFFRGLAQKIKLKNFDDEKQKQLLLQNLEQYTRSLNKVVEATANVLHRTFAWLVASVLPMVGLAIPQPLVKCGVIIVGGLGILALAVEEISKFWRNPSPIQKAGLAKQKENINEAMGKLKSPILVIVDDIDRLTESEIRRVFQIVKANADFPNVIYLLLCDDQVVAKALEIDSPGHGKEFLEKIVQIGHHIPFPSSVDVVDYLREEVIRKCPELLDGKFHFEERWEELQQAGWMALFQNLRHVKRFLNRLDIHAHGYRRMDGTFDVNPVDLLVIESIALFYSSIYTEIFNIKLDLVANTSKSKPENKAVQRIDDTFSLAGKNKDTMGNLFSILFPITSSITSTMSPQLIPPRYNDDKMWEPQKRICHPRHFDVYFMRRIPAKEVSRFDIGDFLESVQAQNPARFQEVCKNLNDRGLLWNTFQQLDDSFPDIDSDTFETLVLFLCDASDNFFQDKHNPSSASTWRTASTLICKGLREKIGTKSFELLNKAFTQSTSLSLPIHIIDDCESERESRLVDGHRFSVYYDPPLITDIADLQSLKATCIGKIEDGSMQMEFLKLPREVASFCLDNLRKWGKHGELKKWLEHHIVTAEDAISLLQILLEKETSFDRSPTHARIYYMEAHIPWSIIDDYFSVARMKDLIDGYEKTKLPPGLKQIAVKAFENAFQRQADGRSDDSFKDDPEHIRYKPEEEDSWDFYSKK